MDHLSATLLEALQQGVSGDVPRMTPEPPSAGLHVALLASRCPQAAARAPLLGERPQLERDNADARAIIGFPVLGHRVGWLGRWEQNGSEVGAGCRVGGAEPWRTPRP